MKYSFHPEAETELLQAIAYYEDYEVNLGYDFAVEVYSTIERIISFPNAWPILAQDVRRCLINRFPYGILYSVEDDEIFILAVMHMHRDPDYWKKRVR
jgi:plasmid stabilization system protein ParE